MNRLLFCQLSMLCFLLPVELLGQSPNRPVPDAVLPYHFEIIDSSMNPDKSYLVCQVKPGLGNAQPAMPTIIDPDGYISAYIPSLKSNNIDFKYLPAIQRYVFASFELLPEPKATYWLYDDKNRRPD